MFWVTFHFEWHSSFSDIPVSVTIYFQWHSILIDIPFSVTFHFKWHSILSYIPFWVSLHFEWHSNLSDILFWLSLHFKWLSNLSDIRFEWHSIMSEKKKRPHKAGASLEAGFIQARNLSSSELFIREEPPESNTVLVRLVDARLVSLLLSRPNNDNRGRNQCES